MKKLANWQTKLSFFGGILAISLIALGSGKALAFSGSGDGSSGNPFQITNCAQLQSIGDDVTAYYELANNINCSGSASFNGGDGWLPIVGFTGSLDGQNHSITNLTINRPISPNLVGLFAFITSNGVVKNLTLTANVTALDQNSGILSGGLSGNAQIINVTTHGSLNCSSFCGSFAGFVQGHIAVSDSHSDANVFGDIKLGGLFGKVDCVGPGHTLTLTNSYYSGSVYGTGILVGGIAGPSQGLILNKVFSNGTVTGTNNVGGLVAQMSNIGSISLSYSTANVYGVDNVGGLVGSANGFSLSMDNVYYYGSIVSTGTYVGGLAGNGSFDHVSFGYAAGSITGNDIVGGLFGNFSNGTLDHLFAVNAIDLSNAVIGDALVAGFSGFNPIDIGAHASHLYFDPNITGLISSSFGTSIANSAEFIDNSGGPVFNGWTFDVTHWRTNFNTYPSFAPMIDPYLLCEAPNSTNTTISEGCVVAPLGWGTATWEVRWSVHGKNSWHIVDLDDVRFANDVTVGGLTPGTRYDLQFSFTNDFGTDGGIVEILTTGTAPKNAEPIATPTYNQTSSTDSSSDATTVPTAKTTPIDQLVTTTAGTDIATIADPKVVNGHSYRWFLWVGLIIALLALIGLLKGSLFPSKPKL
ncbi:MAG TPA: hypothetical protein VLF39_00060 [Candidatus Saccharimonadales bacterium]|nr:hypothetical protein [Candidatus Saccharimonadales bacterium]